MRLPPDTTIAADKLTMYLLAHRTRNDKSRWLAQAGYSLRNWQQLERDLRQQILPREAELDETNQYGHVYRIKAELVGPNGIVLRAITIWMTEHETGQTKLITMYPQ
jgi:hypothetical protein